MLAYALAMLAHALAMLAYALAMLAYALASLEGRRIRSPWYMGETMIMCTKPCTKASRL
jgi:hypothetical protein